MIAAWMLHATLVSAALGAAAVLGGRVFALHALPTRLVWVLAMGGSLVLPLRAWMEPAAPAPEATAAIEVGPVTALLSEAVSLTEPLQLSVAQANPVLLWIWIGMSAGLFVGLLLTILRLAVRRRRWQTAAVDGEAVIVSEREGPFVAGLFPPRIVLPRWVVEGAPEERRLVLAHEREHLRAGDPWLLALAGAALVATPWNAALWWQTRRLSLAIETDCDRRVLDRYPGRRAYCDLLLKVGGRAVRPLDLVLASLTDSKSLLERRIETMIAPRSRHRWMRSLVLGALGIACLAVACEAPAPEDNAPAEGAPVAPVAVAPGGPGGGGGAATDTILLPYPRDSVGFVEFRDASPDTGTALVQFERAASQAEARRQLEEAASRLVETRGETPPPIVAGLGDVSPPSPTPFDVAPVIVNAQEVTTALLGEYPPLLRAAGVGGNAVVWLFVSRVGSVENASVAQSSGYQEFDNAALRVARVFRFTPATLRGQPTPVWIEIPISFHVVPPAG